MTVTFRNDGAWGPGKGSRLTSTEVDTNFWSLLQQLEDLAASGGPAGKLITSTSYAGNTLTINYSDGSQDIIPLPVAFLNFPAVPWANSQAYDYLDVVNSPPLGTFVCVRAHVSPPPPATFDPAATDGSGNPLWQLLIPAGDVNYDVAAFVPGQIDRPAGGVVLQIIMPRAMRMLAGLDGDGFAYLGTAIGGGANITLAIVRNDTQIGTITFALGDTDSAGGQAGTVSFPAQVDFVAGDLLIVTAIASADPAAADLSITLPAIRMDQV